MATNTIRQQAIFRYPKGLWYSNSTSIPDNYASELTNFIPTIKGLEARKGNLILDNSRVYSFITSFTAKNILVSITNQKTITLYELATGNIIDEIEDKGNINIPIFAYETNARIIFFYKNTEPYQFYFDNDDNSYKYKPLDIYAFDQVTGEPIPLPFVNYDGCVRYRERLFFFKEGKNQLWYTESLKFEGPLTSYDVSDIFNAKGNLKNINVAGYSAGAGVQSHLVVAFDSGDILVFDGNNPKGILTGDWKVLTTISTNTELFNTSTLLGTSLLILSSQGLIDLSIAIADNSLTRAKELNDALRDRKIDYSKYIIFTYSDFLILSSQGLTYDYIYNVRTNGWAKLSGVNIVSYASIKDRVFYSGVDLTLNEAFINSHDETVDEENNIINVNIKYTYISGFKTFNNSNMKKNHFAILDIFQDKGIYDINFNVLSDYDISARHETLLPKQESHVLTWGDFKTWEDLHPLAWASSTSINLYNTIKLGRGALGRTLGFRIDVTSIDVATLLIGNITLEYSIGIL